MQYLERIRMKSGAVEPKTEVLTRSEISHLTQEIIDATPVVDIHTHLFPWRFGALLSWGIDDLFTHPYVLVFLMAGFAYLVALAPIHLLVPQLEPVEL